MPKLTFQWNSVPKLLVPNIDCPSGLSRGNRRVKADDSAKRVTMSPPEVISCMGTPQMCKLVPHYISSDSLIIKALYTDKLGQLSKINYHKIIINYYFQNFFHQNTKIHPLQILEFLWKLCKIQVHLVNHGPWPR